MDFVQQLTWDGLGSYNNATRKAFTDPRDRQTDMFIKAHQALKFYWILGAGHAVSVTVLTISLILDIRFEDCV